MTAVGTSRLVPEFLVIGHYSLSPPVVSSDVYISYVHGFVEKLGIPQNGNVSGESDDKT
jgi:hypothetical protein